MASRNISQTGLLYAFNERILSEELQHKKKSRSNNHTLNA